MEEKVLDMLEKICEDDIIRENPDMNLFEEDLLDSLGFAELLVDIEEEFEVLIPPSEIDRSQMDTVNKIIATIQARS